MAYEELSTNEHLLRNRVIYLSGDIATTTAESVVSRLFVMDAQDHDAEIKLFLSSFGGSVYAGLAIYDAMQLIAAPVSTLCIGPAFSMAAWLLAAGEPGRRFATPSSRIMVHQASAGFLGTTSDIKVAAENVIKNEQLMVELLARHTGRADGEIRRAIERDLWMTPEDAIAFGMIDGIAPYAERKRAPALSPVERASASTARAEDGSGVKTRYLHFPAVAERNRP